MTTISDHEGLRTAMEKSFEASKRELVSIRTESDGKPARYGAR
jgi:hypothetical protein